MSKWLYVELSAIKPVFVCFRVGRQGQPGGVSKAQEPGLSWESAFCGYKRMDQ